MSDELKVNYVLIFIVFLTIFLYKIVPYLSEMISKRFFLPEPKEMKSMKEASEIKREMNQISITDDFVKYSKLQRRLNQLTLDIESSVGCRKELQSKLSRAFSILFLSLTASIYFSALLYHGASSPVFVIPKNWFFPLGKILALPNGAEGTVSIPMFTFLTKNAIGFVLHN